MINNFAPSKNTIYVDLDGVLADFDAFVFANMGRVFTHETGPAGDKEMWEFLASVSNLYYILEPTPYAHELWDHIKSFGSNVEILTAIPRRTTIAEAEQNKRDWVAKHFGTDVKMNIGPYSADKWKHAKPGDILVDDRGDNIRDWINHGFGTGILHVYTDHINTMERLTAAISPAKI
jgi:hypothetical protein